MLRSLTQSPLLPAAEVADVRDWLRLAADAENALLARCILAATQTAEQHLGLALVGRAVAEVLPITGLWQTLSVQPFLSVTAVEGLPAEGGAFALTDGSYSLDDGGLGDAQIRVTAPGAAGRVRVTYRAGMAADVVGLPDPVRQGVIMLAAHLYESRDAETKPPVPVSIPALWQPWRRMRLA